MTRASRHLLLLVLPALAACGSGDPASTSRPPADLLEFRAVTAVSAEPCAGGARALDGQCFQLGATVADAEHVESVRGRSLDPETGELTIRFTDVGLARLNEFAADNVGRQLAIVVDDELIMAPVIHEPSFAEEVSVTGAFSAREIDALVSVFTASGVKPSDS